MSDIKAVDTRTVKWQCSGCDHLCAILVDSYITPVNIDYLYYSKSLVTCRDGKWRKV